MLKSECCSPVYSDIWKMRVNVSQVAVWVLNVRLYFVSQFVFISFQFDYAFSFTFISIFLEILASRKTNNFIVSLVKNSCFPMSCILILSSVLMVQ